MALTDDQQTIARILKVNHAGEFGAIRIYRAQLWVAKACYTDLAAFLEETLSHEMTHCRLFVEAMPSRQSRPCHAMSLWGIGGWVLGFITAVMGRHAIMICTKAVEQTVHRHLDEQIGYLAGKDDELRDLVSRIQIEENAHLEYAVARFKPSVFADILEHAIVFSTELVIWLSTQGAVTRMQKAIHRDS